LTELQFNSILLRIEWMRSFNNMLPYVKFAEDKVLIIVILRENAKNTATVSLALILTLISRADMIR